MKFCIIYKLKNKKLQGYALAFAVFIFTVVIILSSTLILAAYYNNYFFNRIIIADKLNDNATSAINLLLVRSDLADYNNPTILSLYDEYGDSVKIEKEQWGVFDLVTVTAFHKNMESKRSAILGNYKYDSVHIALFVPDEGKPISVTGNIEIAGNCLLPESGFKQAHIEGKSYTGSNTNSSNIKNSNGELPALNENIAGLDLNFYLNTYVNNFNRVIQMEELLEETLVVPFQDSTTILYSTEAISLDNMFLQGKIIVLSEKGIYIDYNAQLEDIICIAPYIEVDDHFTGKLQLFAGDSIYIGKGCELNYPSVAGISASNRDESIKITIDENSTLSGLIFLYGKTEASDRQPVFTMEKGSLVKGQVYSSGYTSIKGSIYGALYTRKFITSTPSAIYENTLMDATINMFRLTSNYVGVDLIGEQTQGNIIKWVY